MTKSLSKIPDFEETRAGYRSGEGVDSVLKHLMATARRRQKQSAEVPDSSLPPRPPEEGSGRVDIPLPP